MRQSRAAPLFRVGQRVCYKGNRRLRNVIREVYWDKKFPAYRYRFENPRVTKDLAPYWAVVESELEAVPLRFVRTKPKGENDERTPEDIRS